jgi:hypothetical protein
LKESLAFRFLVRKLGKELSLRCAVKKITSLSSPAAYRLNDFDLVE